MFSKTLSIYLLVEDLRYTKTLLSSIRIYAISREGIAGSASMVQYDIGTSSLLLIVPLNANDVSYCPRCRISRGYERSIKAHWMWRYLLLVEKGNEEMAKHEGFPFYTRLRHYVQESRSYDSRVQLVLFLTQVTLIQKISTEWTIQEVRLNG